MNTITRETVVVFKHTLDIDAFPEVNTVPPEMLKALLDKAVVQMFQLRVREAELNANSSGTATISVEVR